MSNKIHYIIKNEFSGCITSTITRIKYFTNEKECLKELRELKKQNNEKRIIYYNDFEFSSELLKQHEYLFKDHKMDIEVLNNNLLKKAS